MTKKQMIAQFRKKFVFTMKSQDGAYEMRGWNGNTATPEAVEAFLSHIWDEAEKAGRKNTLNRLHMKLQINGNKDEGFMLNREDLLEEGRGS